jgi:hypothetical protein
MTAKPTLAFAIIVVLGTTGCARLTDVGRAPSFQSPVNGNEVYAMNVGALPMMQTQTSRPARASLWRADQQSLLGDRRAGRRGDLADAAIQQPDLEFGIPQNLTALAGELGLGRAISRGNLLTCHPDGRFGAQTRKQSAHDDDEGNGPSRFEHGAQLCRRAPAAKRSLALGLFGGGGELKKIG